MALYLKNFVPILFLIIGCVSVILGFVISGSDYSELLTGSNSKDLSWGPGLFRFLLLFHGGLLIAISLGWEKLTKRFTDVRGKAADGERRDGWRDFGILVLLSVVAIVLRLINLNSDLWVDEVFTLVDYVRHPMGQILTSFPNQNQHMFYSVLARISFDIFGESAWALRLPSVLFGVGSIWALYYLTRSILGKREALLASALMTVSYHHIWFSQNARGYMGLLLFTLLSTWFWFEALKENKIYAWVGYSVAVVLGMWIHMTMAFVVASHGIVYLILLLRPAFGGGGDTAVSFERRAGIRPLIAWFLSITMTLQLYALALPEFLRVGLHEESRNSLWTNPIWVITETLQGLSIGFAGMAVVVCGGAFVLFGWLSLFMKNRRAAVFVVLPPILAGSFMLTMGHNLFPRFFFFAMGFGILIVIHGAMQLSKFLGGYVEQRKGFNWVTSYAGIAFVFFMILVSAITVPRNYALPKQDFSGAKAFVESQRKPGETIVAVSLAGAMYGKYFAPDWVVAEDGKDLRQIQNTSSNNWLVYTLSPEIKAFHPQLWEMIESDYEVVKVFPGTLNGGEIFICRRREGDSRNPQAPQIYPGESRTGITKSKIQY